MLEETVEYSVTQVALESFFKELNFVITLYCLKLAEPATVELFRDKLFDVPHDRGVEQYNKWYDSLNAKQRATLLTSTRTVLGIK